MTSSRRKKNRAGISFSGRVAAAAWIPLHALSCKSGARNFRLGDADVAVILQTRTEKVITNGRRADVVALSIVHVISGRYPNNDQRLKY